MTVIRQFKDEYSFLSNFYPVPNGIVLDGKTYPTVEHAYQASKTIDEEERKLFRALGTTAGRAKRMGRFSITLRDDWDRVRVNYMKHCLEQKFASGTELAKQLIATQDAILIEGNKWNDTFWGADLDTLEGTNKLGELLMGIRDELQKQARLTT